MLSSMLSAGLSGALAPPWAPLCTGEWKVLMFCFVVKEIGRGEGHWGASGQGAATPGVPMWTL